MVVCASVRLSTEGDTVGLWLPSYGHCTVA